MKYRILAGILTVGLVLLGTLHLIASAGATAQRAEMAEKRALVRWLGLTDMALWTEARYTRHPSQADRFAAFQDFPSAIEHFPAGGIVQPPPTLRAPVSGATNKIAGP